MLTEIPIEIIFAYIAGLIILYVIGWFLLVPLRGFVKIFINSIIGGAFLYVISTIEFLKMIHVPLNPINALITGVLGIPGVLLLIAVKLFIFP